MRLRFGNLFVAPLLFLLASCGEGSNAERPVFELAGGAMGTSYNVKIAGSPNQLSPDLLQQQIEQELAVIEQQMSTYIADSELSLFNATRGVDWFAVSANLCHIIADALSLCAASGGAFDVTVGPLVNLWGFGPAGTVTAPPDAASISVLKDGVGCSALHTDCSVPALRKDRPDIYVDLSAIAKGYGVDQLARILDEKNIRDYLVEIGGELRMSGKNAKGDDWAIAIESPARTSRTVDTIIRLTDAAVATSGDYRNYFEHAGTIYSHTIDPRTGYPVTHAAASVTVVAETAAFADAMATALLVLGPDDGLAFAEREQIAARFLLRDDEELSERSSSLFATRVRSQ